MSRFLLVHGAWHGGWVWDEVASRLVARGHLVTAPTMPVTPGTRLHDHVQVLTRQLLRAPEPVVLVAHSYAGLVATQAAALAPDRVDRLVLLDGWVVGAGRSLFDVAPPWFADWCRASATGSGVDALVPPPPATALGLTDAGLTAWLEPRLTPQPLATFTDSASADLPRELPRDAVVCLPPTMPFAELARVAGFRVHEIESDHEVMLSNPGPVAELLDEIAAGRVVPH